jgi:hypothetical protein
MAGITDSRQESEICYLEVLLLLADPQIITILQQHGTVWFYSSTSFEK